MLLVEAGGGEDDADQDTQVHETVTAATDRTPQPTTYTLYIVTSISIIEHHKMSLYVHRMSCCPTVLVFSSN